VCEASSLVARVQATHQFQQVRHGVVCGQINSQIGAALGISEITVQAHRDKVMRKMEAASLAGLVRMAARLRMTPAPQADIRASGHDPLNRHLELELEDQRIGAPRVSIGMDDIL
jgi:hypothetical protein